MITFLPYDTFHESLRSLDSYRLINQIREAELIFSVSYKAYRNGFMHHPAVLMWIGYFPALLQYIEQARLINNQSPNTLYLDAVPEIPIFMGDWNLHSSHRANLFFKKPSFYSRFMTEGLGTSISKRIPYFWPVRYKKTTNAFSFASVVYRETYLPKLKAFFDLDISITDDNL